MNDQDNMVWDEINGVWKQDHSLYTTVDIQKPESELINTKYRTDMDAIAQAIGLSKGTAYKDILTRIESLYLDAELYRHTKFDK